MKINLNLITHFLVVNTDGVKGLLDQFVSLIQGVVAFPISSDENFSVTFGHFTVKLL